MKDPKVLFPWVQTARHLQAIEMEAAGVYRAARDRCLMLAIRGLSDIVGLKRSDAWTKYACASAAAFTKAFLRTRPIEPRTLRSQEVAETSATKVHADAPRLDTLFLNMARVREYPQTIYVAPTDLATGKQVWGRMRDGTTGHITNAWVLHSKCIYSFDDPSRGPLSKVIDATRIEAHDSDAWSRSDDADRRRLFVSLLGSALRDDLGIFSVRFAADDRVFMFMGRPEDPPRTHRYRNARVMSTMTVVQKYPYKAKDGREWTILRHLAFDARFRRVEGEWYLEISPTYRFTTDGRMKSWVHEERLRAYPSRPAARHVIKANEKWSIAT